MISMVSPCFSHSPRAIFDPSSAWNANQEAYAVKGKLEPGQLAKVQRKAELEQVPETWLRFFFFRKVIVTLW